MAGIQFQFFQRKTAALMGVALSVLLSACPKPDAAPVDSNPETVMLADAGQFMAPTDIVMDGAVAEIIVPKGVGADCSRHGALDCTGGLCMHSEVTSLSGGRFCSLPCIDNATCPNEWRCVEVFPAKGNTFCVPPRGWQGKEVGP